MSTYRNAWCWAAAIVAVAVGGMYGVIDEGSMTTLLIALPFAG